jgi:hypothetical protein
VKPKRKMNKRKPQKSINRRVDVAPEGGTLAKLGFYTRQVQAIVRKWEGKVPRDMLEDYFRVVAMPVVTYRSCNATLHFRFVIPEHWPLVFQLGKAIADVMADDRNIDKWLLTLPISVASNGKWESWDSLAEDIGKRVGQSRSTGFTDKVKVRAKRLRLLTPPDEAADFLSSWPVNPAVTKSPRKT